MKLTSYFDKFETTRRSEHPEFSEKAMKLLEDRYFISTLDDDGNVVFKEKTIEELAQRVSRCLASAETMYTNDVKRIKLIENNIYNDIIMQRFLFNSPALFNLGRGVCNDHRRPELHYLVYKPIDKMTFKDYQTLFESKNIRQMCFACFVVGMDDSLSSIMDSMKDAAMISKAGGGVGASFDITRERNATVHGGMSGKASGPVSWIKMWDGMAGAVVQGGQRRAALMGMINVDHPDIFEFVHAKDEDGELSRFNLSVAITEDFMNKVINSPDDKMVFVSRHNKKPVEKVFVGNDDKGNPIYRDDVTVGELWNEIAEHAWKRGDPGVFFIDRANYDNILKVADGNKYKINATNPCGEQCLFNNSACNLGSINLNSCISTKDNKLEFKIDELVNQVFRSVYYLDLIIDASSYPLDSIKETTYNIRPIGLGIMGLADLIFRAGFSYDSDDAKGITEMVANIMALTALDATIKLTTEVNKPAFPDSHIINKMFWKGKINASNYDSLDDKMFSKMVEANIPYTLLNTLNKFPVFKTLYEEFADERRFKTYIDDIMRNVISGNMRNSRRLTIAPTGSTSMIFDASSGLEPNFALEFGRKIFSANTTDQKVTEFAYTYKYLNDDEIKILKDGGKLEGGKYTCANDVSIDGHVDIVAIFAKYVDSSISKTLNILNDATVDDVKNAYLKAYQSGCKGVTIYRDGSRSMQPITKTIETKNNKEEEKPIVKKDEQPVIPTAIKKVKSRPRFVTGITESTKTSLYGNLYVTVNFDENGEIFEIFANLGKPGGELLACVNAIARIISIALRSGTDIKDIVKTSMNITSSANSMWIYDADDGSEVIMTSIPDAIAKLITEIVNKAKNNNIIKANADETVNKDDKPAIAENKPFIELNDNDKGIPRSTKCPDCGSNAVVNSNGCKVCLSCGWSACGI